MSQYDDMEFCQEYKGCCGTCLARDTEAKMCLGNCDYATSYTKDDFTCEAYVPCRMADEMLERDREEENKRVMKYFED